MPSMIVVVRPKGQLARSVAQVRERWPGREVLGVGISDCVPVERLEVPEGVTDMVLTSGLAVREDLPRRLPVWCVGPATAAAAEKAGLTVAGVGPGDARGLAGMLAGVAGRKVFWHVRADNAGVEWHDGVGGHRVVGSVGYETRMCDDLPPEMAARLNTDARWTLVMSRAGAKHLLQLMERARVSFSGCALAPSAAVAEILAGAFGEVRVAAQPTWDSVLELLAEDLNNKTGMDR